MSDRSRLKAIAYLLLAFCLALPSIATAQDQHADTVVGRVSGSDGAAIEGVHVMATSKLRRSPVVAITDAEGRYAIVDADGTGDYLVHAAKIGYEPARNRVTRKTETERVLVCDISLSLATAALSEVHVQARARPSRAPSLEPAVGAEEKIAGNLDAFLPPGDRDDLNAIAATLPGVSLTNGGISVFGLGAEQSSVTLNGMSFSGTKLPRGAKTRVRVSTTSFDPSQGNFSGAQTAIELAPALAELTFRTGYLTLDSPALRFGENANDRGRPSNISLGSTQTGGLLDGRLAYSVSADLTHRYTSALSLLNLNDREMEQFGLAPDSAKVFLNALQTHGVQVALPGVASALNSNSLTALARIDHTANASRTWNVTGYLDASASNGSSVGATSLPTGASHASSMAATLQGGYSAFLGGGGYYLNDTKFALNASRSSDAPYLALPTGVVLVTSDLPSAPAATDALGFGGGSFMAERSSESSVELSNQTTWYERGKSHRLQVSATARYDRYSEPGESNTYGSFIFRSLGDLAAGNPTSYSRTFGATPISGGALSGSLAAGDVWRPSSALSLSYGLRLDGNHFVRAPESNAGLVEALGIASNVSPGMFDVSPRLGFTWAFGGTTERSEIATPGGDQYIPPTGTFHGGIGKFVDRPSASLLSPAIQSAGRYSGVTINCVGAATPFPNWDAYANDLNTIPTQCSGEPGSVSSTLTDTAPSAVVFDKSYRPAQSWRSNLGLTLDVKGLTLGIDGTYTLNLDQRSDVDANFDDSPQFELADEASRPVFASPSSIVPATGIVSPTAARRSSAFSRVSRIQSDLRSHAEYLTISGSPVNGSVGPVYLSGSYTLAGGRAQTRGFGATTSGDPLLAEWAPLGIARHQLILSAGMFSKYGVWVSLGAQVRSGIRFTPLVAGDINGDGLSNDRAFVFDPGNSLVPVVANGLDSLLASAKPSIRSCLRSQAGRIAATASCSGPWSASLNLRFSVTGDALHISKRLNLALDFVDPLGGLDELLHGANRLHGWGESSFPDPILYRIHSFDEKNRRYVYDVNPRFGRSATEFGAGRTPFGVILDATFDLGVPVESQIIQRVLSDGRDGSTKPRMTAEKIRVRYARSVADLATPILAAQDSLFLSKGQVQSLQAADAEFRARSDSVWRPLGEYLAALPNHYDVNAALIHVHAARDSVDHLLDDEAAAIKRIVQPAQLRLLPDINETIDSRTSHDAHHD